MVFGFRSRQRRASSTGDAAGRRASPVTVAVLFLSVGSIAICGICGGALYYFQPHVVENPDAVAILMGELVTIDVPQAETSPVRFRPRGSIEWNLAYMMSLRGAYYETVDPQQDGVLMFLEVTGASLQKPDVRAHIDRMLRERGGAGPQLKPNGRPDYRVLTVRGQPAEFTFETAVDPVTKEDYRLINGIVTGNRWHDVLITLRIKSAPPWNDSVAVGMIESIQ